MRVPHHPDCALSRDIALSADEELLGYRAPKCTCREWRREQAKLKAARTGGGSGARLGDGTISIGSGNYWRAPSSDSDLSGAIDISNWSFR